MLMDLYILHSFFFFFFKFFCSTPTSYIFEMVKNINNVNAAYFFFKDTKPTSEEDLINFFKH